jgi:hypothetical protein
VELRSGTPNPAKSEVFQPHIVIPYNYADHEFASKLTAELRYDRITPWIDDVDMSAGVLLVSKIANAVRPVDCIVPAVSAASVGSSWVEHDLKLILARTFNGRHVRVLPARVDGCPMPEFLSSRPFFDFQRSGWSAAFDELVIAIHERADQKVELPGSRLSRPARLT